MGFFLSLLILARERDHVSGRGAERENQAGSALTVGLEPTNGEIIT